MEELLAKDDEETLSQHVSECVKIARRIVPSLPLSEDEKPKLLNDTIIALALHDVGKAATGFQDVLRKKKQNWNGWRHEILSASFASAIPSVTEAVIFAILTHHKSIPNTSVQTERRALDREYIPLGEPENSKTWLRMKKEWSDNYDSFHESWVKICDEIQWEDFVGMKSLPGLKLDAAWLERGANPFAQLRKKSYEERRYFSLVRGLLIACDHLASAHYQPNTNMDTVVAGSRTAIQNGITQSPRGFQTQMANTLGSAILRAPTGSGKTDAALLWATRNAAKYSRLYYVLPNIASINAMLKRLQTIYGKDSVGLLHSRARAAIYRSLQSGEDLESKPSNEKNSRMLSSVAHTIWFPVRVCTPYQVLRFSLRGSGWESMLAEFPNALFVFDEIHAYDARLIGQIIATAKLVSRWNARCTFLSATMPSFLTNLLKVHVFETSKDDNAETRLVTPDPTIDREILQKKRHRLILDTGTLLDHVDDIAKNTQNGSKVLVVCNSVRASQEVFQAICEKLGKRFDSQNLDKEIMLLHSRFTARDRNDKETRIMDQDRQPRILVATQVVEVSLDISYDIAYLEPAPIDATIQRMGRVNRKGESTPAPVHLMSKEISHHSVYRDQDIVKTSWSELCKFSETGVPLSESEIVEAADRVYKDGFIPQERFEFDSGVSNAELVNFEAEMLAGASEDWKDKVLSDQTGIDVLPSILKKEFDSLIEKKLFAEAYGLVVPMQYWSLGKYEYDYSKDYHIFIMDCKYSVITGLAVDNRDQSANDLFGSSDSTPSNII